MLAFRRFNDFVLNGTVPKDPEFLRQTGESVPGASALARAECDSASRLTAILLRRRPVLRGGLTKPMWDTLLDRFVDETKSAGRHATARAVVAYCDGCNIYEASYMPKKLT